MNLLRPEQPELKLSIQSLQHKLRKGEFTCEDIVNSCYGRYKQANPQINAVVLPLYDQALEQAREVDRKIAGKELLGPLFGVPVTVKECFDVKGTPATWGLLSRRDEAAEANDPLVERLLSADALLIGKTNLQQLVMGSESDNPVYGRSSNPHRLERTPGGSSGGEGAAVAAHLSQIGLGTDAGGSVRIPAHFCGIHALKPTSGTFSMQAPRGIFTVKPEVARAIVQPGVLARNVDDLRTAYHALSGDTWRPEDHDGETAIGNMKIAYFKSDGIVEPSMSMQRLVGECAAVLARHGAEVVEIDIRPFASKMLKGYMQLVMHEAELGFPGTVGNDAVIPKIKGMLKLISMPWPMKRLAALLLKTIKQRTVAEFVLSSFKPERLETLLEQRDRRIASFSSSLMERRIDAILCPPYPTPALKHGGSTSLQVEGAYEQMFNYLGFPAGVVSLSQVKPGEAVMRPKDGDRITDALNETDQGSEGLPIGVQVVSLPGQEGAVLRIMALLEREFMVY
ncbi:amidase [Paenibacillus thalictri]|uniref:Amidase domain-containing protein n=1 Tax=Paenibacillus thalictri TaxID=2527873 RepID=A0A4Q9DS41_9BACL|nr:amidase family protein [Paenibacillus thalictri]TBL78574.1 hypothetical protein EYB31_13810 [Paenibacillus thalictri]